MRLSPLALLLAACSAPEPPPSPKPQPHVLDGRLAAAEDVLLNPDVLTTALATLEADVPSARGMWRVVHGPTACRPAHGVNPGVVVRSLEPRVGQQLRIDFSTRAAMTPPPPSEVTLLGFDFAPALAAPVSLAEAGAPGCWKLVHGGYLLVPKLNGSTLTDPLVQQYGRVHVRFTPPLSMAGWWMSMQLLVMAPENAGGYLLSPAVEVLIGGPL